MSEIFFTSDLHLGHSKPFIYEPRGFSYIEEHDAAIISNINSMVSAQDVLYILGDLMLNDNDNGVELLRQIRCENVFVVLGNHDTDARTRLYEEELPFTVLGCSYRMKIGKRSFMLSHYPTLTANFEDDKKVWERVYNLCGHSHSTSILDPVTNSFHMELDAWHNKPAPLDYVLEAIRACQ